MPLDASIPGVIRLLRALRRRRLVLDGVVAGSIGISIFAAIVWLSAPFMRREVSLVVSAAISLTAAASLLLRSRQGRTLNGLARGVEAARTGCRNLVVTAEELDRFPQRASPWMRSTVMERASEATAGIGRAEVAPAGRAAGALLVTAVLVAAVVVAPPPDRLARSMASFGLPGSHSGEGGAGSIVVTVRPPSYAQLAETSVRDPQRLDVLEGSLVTLSTSARTSRSVRFGTQSLGVLADGGSAIQFMARDSG